MLPFAVFVAALSSVVISSPFVYVAFRSGAFERPINEIIESAKAAGRFARARLVNYKRGSDDSDFIVTYSYDVDGHRYEYEFLTSNYGIDEFITVYWKKGKPDVAYIEGQQDCISKYKWVQFLPFTLFVALLWLMSLVFGVGRFVL